MHLRNPYRTPPDFSQLAEFYPLLKPFVFINKHGQPAINFKDDAAQRYLTEALLRRDFGLRIELPPDRLCPAVDLIDRPQSSIERKFKNRQRLNYILWIQDIMTASPGASRPVRGIDIGTGASVIYPFLGCAVSPSWSFIATEVDEKSYTQASKNVAYNSLQNQILLHKSSFDGPLFSHLFEDDSIRCDFLMCNPPFYGSKQEVMQAAEDKEFDPNAVCTGADVEMITEDGEAGFVKRLVEESVVVGNRCRWYTSLLGKLSSISSVVTLLRSLKIDNYGLTEFIQGHTRRWAVAWSFGTDRLPDTLVRETSESLHAYLPQPNNLRQKIPFHSPKLASASETSEATEWGPVDAVDALKALCGELEGVYSAPLQANVSNETSSPDSRRHTDQIIKIWGHENTWSRKARRKREQMKRQIPTSPTPMSDMQPPNQQQFEAASHNVDSNRDDGNAKVVMFVRASLDTSTKDNHSSHSSHPSHSHSTWILEASWSRGADRELFESLWNHLSRKLSNHSLLAKPDHVALPTSNVDEMET